MVFPIYIAWHANKTISQQQYTHRIQTIRSFLNLQSDKEFILHTIIDEQCGLVFIELRNNTFTIPLCHSTENSLSLSAYLPFGVSQFVERQKIVNGLWIAEILKMVSKQPNVIRELAPPQVFCQLDKNSHILSLANDWRGFGRLYEYNTNFGKVWSNKMAAALIFAGEHAHLDKNSLADMAAFGMFSGESTGYENLRLCGAGTVIKVNTLSDVVHHTQDHAVCGITREKPASDAVEKTHDAIKLWVQDLALFSKGKIKLMLSGGRDSRVVAAALLACGIDFDAVLSHPPAKDAELAKKLLQVAHSTVLIDERNRFHNIKQRYSELKDLLSISNDILLKNNSDISVSSYLKYPSQYNKYNFNENIRVGGNQGECTHNNYYSDRHFHLEETWNHIGTRPSKKQIYNFIDFITVKSFGVTNFCGNHAKKNIHLNVLSKARNANFVNFYALDFLYISLYLTRQWAGANGAYDVKTPLTVYPYVQNGINQEIQSKLNSRFVREIVTSFLPIWRDIPFFHELPQEEIEDFYVAYPTYWEMGRGYELLDLCKAKSIVWEYFDQELIITTINNLIDQNYYTTFPSSEISIINQTIQKILWIMTIEKNLFIINKLTKLVNSDD